MNREERIAQDTKRYNAWGTPVTFYSQRDKNGIGSNFSRHGIWLPNPFTGEQMWYATGEHRYQAMKATNADDHAYVNAAGTAGESKRRGGPRGILLRDGWGETYGDLCWYVMLEVIYAKATQNTEARNWLHQTGNALIYEDSPVDDIWGWRFEQSYEGRNLLGRCWMQVRAMLR